MAIQEPDRDSRTIECSLCPDGFRAKRRGTIERVLSTGDHASLCYLNRSRRYALSDAVAGDSTYRRANYPRLRNGGPLARRRGLASPGIDAPLPGPRPASDHSRVCSVLPVLYTAQIVWRLLGQRSVATRRVHRLYQQNAVT